MSDSYPSWLQNQLHRHIVDHDLNNYVMALEGWRHGLELTWHNNYDNTRFTINNLSTGNGKVFSLRSPLDYRVHYFYGSNGDFNRKDALEKTANKTLMKSQLRQSNISTIDHQDLPKEHLDDYCDYNHDYGKYRLYIINDKVVAATKILPLYVVGNGVETIAELINQKNENRKQNHYLKNKLVEIDDDLEDNLSKHNLSIQHILPENHKIIFPIYSISEGAQPVDVTETVNEDIKNIAIKSIQSFNGLFHAGIELFVEQDGLKVLNIYPNACLGVHMFPEFGKPRNVSTAIIKGYFPEMEQNSRYQERFYFDYNAVQKALNNFASDELVLNSIPKGKIYTERYIVSGKIKRNYLSWIKREAVKSNIHGYVRKLSNGKIVIVVASNQKAILNKFRKTFAKGPKDTKIRSVKKLEWDGAIKLGFEIRSTR